MSPTPPNPPQNRGLTAIDGAVALVVILLMVQMWLLTATLESYLAGYRDVALPALLVSGALFLLSFGIYRFTAWLDSGLR